MDREERVIFRRAQRSTLTTPERVLWSRLRRKQLHGFKFRRQHQVGDYVLDFYCVERRLAIEVDGDSHYGERGPRRDEYRSVMLARAGIRVLRFTNVDVLVELDGVVEAIILELQRPPPSLPRRHAPGEEPSF
jgi:very-short-patch-repair endonuclease